jgi:hypothetical protein
MNRYAFPLRSIYLPTYIDLTTIVSGTKICNIYAIKSLAVKNQAF